MMDWIVELALNPVVMVLVLLIVLSGIGFALFNAGRRYEQTHYEPKAKTPPVEYVPEYSEALAALVPAIPDEKQMEALEMAFAMPGPIELLATTTGPMQLAIDSPVMVLDLPDTYTQPITVIAEIVEPEPDLSAEYLLLQAAHEMTLEKLARTERARARHWKSLKITRARLKSVLEAAYDATRRMPREKLLAEVIDIGTARRPERVHVLPPAVVHDWRERELVAL